MRKPCTCPTPAAGPPPPPVVSSRWAWSDVPYAGLETIASHTDLLTRQNVGHWLATGLTDLGNPYTYDLIWDVIILNIVTTLMIDRGAGFIFIDQWFDGSYNGSVPYASTHNPWLYFPGLPPFDADVSLPDAWNDSP